MPKQLEFFYDYVSVYSYLADSQLDKLEGADVVFRPMFLGAVMQATGNRPPATVKAKGSYLLGDVMRWARHYALPLTMNPKFPQNTLSALRLALHAQKSGHFAALHRLLFDAMWVRQEDLEDEVLLSALASRAGMDAPACMKALDEQSLKDELKSNTEEAVARGAFGAPTIFVGNQMFFGNDRFDFVREAIR
jgi:2-hydroxychromene-2-carboxylate isomerase